MSHAVKETRVFSHPAADVLAAAGDIVVRLGGKRPRKDPGVAGQVHADFNKEVGGRSFANRVHVIIGATEHGPGGCTVSVEAYPVDPLGNRLQFGVIGDPARLVASAVWQRLEARLTPDRVLP
jgi:hypothetical protein